MEFEFFANCGGVIDLCANAYVVPGDMFIRRFKDDIDNIIFWQLNLFFQYLAVGQS